MLMLQSATYLFADPVKNFRRTTRAIFSIIQPLAKYDTILDKLLPLSKDSPKYLGPLIQNELISVLTEKVLRDIKSELQSAPFFAIIVDTTQDVSKKRPVK